MNGRYNPVPLLGPVFAPTSPDVARQRRLSRPAQADPSLRELARPGTSDAQAIQGLEPIMLPPWLYPPFNARGVLLPLSHVPAVLAPAASTFVTWPAIPNGKFGVVYAMGLSTTSFPDTRITTMINRNPVDPYAGVVGAIGTLDEPQPLPAPIIVPASAVFEVQITNTGAGAITVAVITKGWWY